MRFIDYIFKNLDVDHLLEDLKKNPRETNSTFAKLVLKNTWDTNSIKNRLAVETLENNKYFSVNGIKHGKKLF